MASYHSNGGQSWQQQHEAQHAQMVSSSLPAVASPVLSKQSSVVDENLIVLDYKPPGSFPPPDHLEHQSNNNKPTPIAKKRVQWVYNPLDGSVCMDHNGDPLSVDRILATKPLKHELSTRPGPGNKKLTYISGDDVSRTLNDVFGFDGWDLDIKDVSRVDASKDPKTGKHTIVYTARVRLTHKASGAYKEDCGAGDSTDRVYGTAIAHALKASITDAMKRAARHFGDKLGNSLYAGNFSINKAPVSLRDALDKYDIHRCNTKFGFQKPKKKYIDPKMSNASSTSTSTSYNHPSMPPPAVPASKNDTNIPPRQYQNHGQQQRQKDSNTTMNSHASTNSRSLDPNRKKLQNHAYDKNAQPSNNYQQHQNQTSIPSSNRQPQAVSSTTTGISASDIVRPTSSYGRRPTPGSTDTVTVGHLGSSSGNIAISGMSATMTSANSGQPFNPHDNKYKSGRRGSVEQNNTQYQRQPNGANNPPHLSMNNANANAHMVSQTPSMHGNNSYSTNAQHKRPPLGAIPHNQTASGLSGESSAKRPKHNNPYNQSLGGRKSI